MDRQEHLQRLREKMGKVTPSGLRTDNERASEHVRYNTETIGVAGFEGTRMHLVIVSEANRNAILQNLLQKFGSFSSLELVRDAFEFRVDATGFYGKFVSYDFQEGKGRPADIVNAISLLDVRSFRDANLRERVASSLRLGYTSDLGIIEYVKKVYDSRPMRPLKPSRR